MATYFQAHSRAWRELHPGVFISELHRYAAGGGAALFKLEAGALLPFHNHSTGEHALVLEGTGMFGDQMLAVGDALWMERNEGHEVRAITALLFFATSLPWASEASNGISREA